jgi:hypothetical protein
MYQHLAENTQHPLTKLLGHRGRYFCSGTLNQLLD